MTQTAKSLDSEEIKNQKKSQNRYIQQISKKAILPWVAYAALDWGIIIGTLYTAYALDHIIIYLLAILIIGNRQHALAILGHDGAHFSIHDVKSINDFFANLLCFWPLLITVTGYRKLHFQHHKNTGTVHDPELMHKSARAPQWDLPMKKKKLLQYASMDLFGYSIPDLIIILTFSRPEKNTELLPVILIHALSISLLISANLWWVAALWYVSLATSFMMFFRLRLWLEHQGTEDTQRVKLTWWQGHLLAPHNIWLHWEHHKWPTVPHHQLKRARQQEPQPSPLSIRELIEQIETADIKKSGSSSHMSLVEQF